MKNETTKTVKIENVIDLAIATKLNAAFIQGTIEFCKGGETLQAWDIVENWVNAGTVFAAIKNVVPKKEFNATVDSFYGETVNKNNRSASMKLAEIGIETLKAWYVESGQVKTSPTTILAAFNGRDKENEGGGKTDIQKIEEMILTLSKRLKKAAMSDIQAASISSKLLELSNIDLSVEIIEERKTA